MERARHTTPGDMSADAGGTDSATPRRAPAGTESGGVSESRHQQELRRPMRGQPGALSGNNFVVPDRYNANFSSKYLLSQSRSRIDGSGHPVTPGAQARCSR